VDIVLAGQLVDRPVGFVGRQGDLGLEPRRMNLPLDRHWFPSSGPRIYLNHWSRKRGPLHWRKARIQGTDTGPAVMAKMKAERSKPATDRKKIAVTIKGSPE
jgi:hypothetical protein